MSKFVSNIIKLSSATMVGQILGIIVTPVLSRLYSPSDYGVFEIFFSIVSVIAVISCLSYASAIQLPKKDEDAANIVVLCIGLIGIITGITTVVFFMFSGNIAQLFNLPVFSVMFLFLLPFAVISSSIPVVLNSWVARKAEFGTIAKASIVSSVTGKSVSLGFGFISPSPVGLILGTITNDATIALVLFRKSMKNLNIFRIVSFEKIKHGAVRYKKFPQYNAVADLAGSASVAATPLMLGIMFSSSIVGYYAMAVTVITLPSRFLGTAVASVFYQKTCVEKNSSGAIKNIVNMVHSRLVSLGLFAYLIIMIIGPELFTFALGSRWTNAGIYAQIISPLQFVVFLSFPLASILNVLEKQNVNFWFSIISLSSKIIVFIIAFFIVGLNFPISVLVLLSIFGIIIWGCLNMYIIKIAGGSVSEAVQEILRYLVIGIIFCSPLIIAKFLLFPEVFLFTSAVVLSVLYYTFIIYRDIQLKQELMEIMNNISQKWG